MGSCGLGSSVAKLQDLECVFGNILSLIIPTAGVIFFVMLIVGGFKYMTAAGDPASVSGAHKTITYAIGGLLVTASAFTILAVLEFVTGSPIRNFQIFR